MTCKQQPIMSRFIFATVLWAFCAGRVSADTVHVASDTNINLATSPPMPLTQCFRPR